MEGQKDGRTTCVNIVITTGLVDQKEEAFLSDEVVFAD